MNSDLPIDQSPLMGENVRVSTSKQDSSSSDDTNDLTHAPHIPTWRQPCSSTKLYVSELSEVFTAKFISWLAIYNVFVYGGAYTLVMSLSLPLFKELGINASEMQLYMTMMIAPFAMKPFIGVASDLFPILGYNKRYYALLGILIGSSGCLVLLWLAPCMNASSDLTKWIVICFAAVNYETATLSILGQGKFSEKTQLHPESGSSIVSFTSGWYFFGCIMAQSLVGPLSDMGDFHMLLWICLTFTLTPLLPTLTGWIPEMKLTNEVPGMMAMCGSCLLFDRWTFQDRKAQIILIILCGLASPLLVGVTTYSSLPVGLGIAAVFIVSFCTATYFVFPKSFFWIFLCIVVNQLSKINIRSALSYYYTASETCVPNGPNFSYTYYLSINGVVGSIMSLLSVLVYERIFRHWRFRPVLIFTLVLSVLASMVDLIIIMRFNIAIGISDKIFFMFGNAIFEHIIGTLNYIPSSAIYAKMTPPGMESAVFAYVIGISNFCDIVTSLIGSGAIHLSGMKTMGEECNFDALPLLCVITQIIVPIIIGVPAMFLVPNVLQTERLIDWGSEGWLSEKNEEPEISSFLASGMNDELGEQDNRTAPLLISQAWVAPKAESENSLDFLDPS